MIKRSQVVRAALVAGFISFGLAAHAQETAPGAALPEVECESAPGSRADRPGVPT